jgi:predicted outer membrane repeat protein
MVIRNSAFIHNAATRHNGGAIANLGPLTLENNLFYGNSAYTTGGAIYNSSHGKLTITNNTFAENMASSGGGIYSSGEVSLTNSSFVDNVGGGLVNEGGGLMQLLNTLLASNSAFNCQGTIGSMGYNLEDGDDCGLGALGDQTASDPLVGPLADNGGPTWTYALLAGSPAINAGTNQGCPPTNQREVARPQQGVCDIGAYEFIYQAVFFLPLVRGAP